MPSSPLIQSQEKHKDMNMDDMIAGLNDDMGADLSE
jgi:hypothetical protein